jgi:hypothetical protein
VLSKLFNLKKKPKPAQPVILKKSNNNWITLEFSEVPLVANSNRTQPFIKRD